MENYNIIDAYSEYNSQLIILISGLSGSNKTKIAQKLAHDLNLDFINLNNFIKKDVFTTIDLANSKKIKYYNMYDWENINIDSKKVIIVSDYFSPDFITNIKPNLHINIKLSKQNLLKNRIKYLKDNNININEENESLLFSQYIYPKYLEFLEKTTVNKFINANEIFESNNIESYNNNISDIIFKYIIDFIINYFKAKNLDKHIIY